MNECMSSECTQYLMLRAVEQLVTGFMMHGLGVALISVVALHGSIFLFGGFT
jgi:hypothetical protein